MSWEKCSCGLSWWGSTQESRHVSLFKCKRRHLEAGDLRLDNGPSGLRTSLFVIISHEGNHNAHAACVQWLQSSGVDKSAIDVVYGFRLGRDYHMDAPIAPNEILHYGVHHRWFPRVAKLLHRRRRQNKRTTAVWFLEADARSQTPLHQLFQAVNGPFPQRLIRWLGWYQWRKGWRYFWSYGRRCLVQLQGSQCIVFKGSALRQMYEKSLSTGRYSHWDLKVWRSFPRSMFWVPKEPLVGTCGHWSEIMGGGQRAWREGIADATARRNEQDRAR